MRRDLKGQWGREMREEAVKKKENGERSEEERRWTEQWNKEDKQWKREKMKVAVKKRTDEKSSEEERIWKEK